MTFVSYAQNFEDVMLLRALGHVADGFYIDIGAADPDEYSVTRVFYDRGWRGINVEPLPFYFERLSTARARDLNLNVAVADVTGELPFFRIEDTGLSTLDRDVAEEHRTAGRQVEAGVVKVTTLADLCRQHVTGAVHFLKIDVEGSERAVLAGADFRGFRPWIVLVEATRPLSQEQNYDQWENLLREADYRFAWFDGLNRFYVAHEHWTALSHAFSRPPNVFDDFVRAGDAASCIHQAKARALAAERQTAEAEAQGQRARNAETRLALAQAHLKEIEAQIIRAETRAIRAEERYAEAKTSQAQADARAAQASQAQLLAVQQVDAMRATTSWRVTAPLRALKLTLRGQASLALAEFHIPLDRVRRLQRVGGPDGSQSKKAARIALYAATRAIARIPGAATAANGLARLAPGPCSWAGKRIDAYHMSALRTELPTNATLVESAPSMPPGPMLLKNMATGVHRRRTVHQFHSGSSTGDAITNSMLLIQQWLRKLGYRSDIFVEHRDPRLADRLFEIGDLPLNGDYVLIVHHSLGYDTLNWIVSLPARKILMYHNITPAEFLRDLPTMIPYAELGRRQLSLLRSNVDAALADSEFNALELRGYGYDAPVSCPFLFDVNELIKKAEDPAIRSTGTPYTLLFVGRVVASKGQADLVEAFAEFRRIWSQPSRLVLVGSMPDPDGLYPKEIRRRIDLHQLGDDVVITGPVTDDDLHAWYSAADVYVSLSHHEGFGVPLVEAMAHGVPVVAWPAGAVPYTLGDAAVLLPDRSPKTVASAVLSIASDATARADIVTKQRLVLERFRLERHAPHFLQALIAAGAAPPAAAEPPQTLLANLNFTIMGHVNKTYSLSSVNRQMALALEAQRPGRVRIVPVEGAPTTDLSEVPSWHARQIGDLVDRSAPTTGPEIVISQHYPIYHPAHRGDLTTAMVFWEESLLPAATVRALNRFDAVFAPSSQVAKALIDSGLAVPLRVVGYAPDLDPFYRLCAERDADQRGIKQSVTLLHVSSCFPRKGVDVLLAAFAKAFRKHDAVRLIIKGFPNPHNDVPEQIEQLRLRDPNMAEIVMVNDDLDDAEMHALYRQADAMVLPTRGEGFNIPAAEAMAAGIPLIVTGYGGHRDFCAEPEARLIDYHFAPSGSHLASAGSFWVEPDTADLALALRETFDAVMSGGGVSALRARRAREMIQKRLDPSVWADEIAATAVEVLTQPRLRRLRVAWVSTWDVPCGVAEYSRSLLEGFGQFHSNQIELSTLVLCDDRTKASPRESRPSVCPAWSLGESGRMNRLARTVANDDSHVVVIQYQPGLFQWHALAAFLADTRILSRVTVVVLHAAQRLNDIDAEERGGIVQALSRVSRVLVHRIADVNLLKELNAAINVVLMPQGAPKIFGLPTARALSKRDSPLIGCYGFFLPGKGIGRLIEAMAQLRRTWPHLRLRLVNAEYPSPTSQAEIARCRQLAASLDAVDLIDWKTEFRPQDECQRLLSECDLLVLPYDDSKESSSAALRGALSSGVPVAVTPVPIFDEADEAVHRFASTDVSSVVQGIDALLSSVQARDDIQRAASKWLAERQWDVIAERMEGMLIGLQQASRHVANMRH